MKLNQAAWVKIVSKERCTALPGQLFKLSWACLEAHLHVIAWVTAVGFWAVVTY